MPRQFSDTIKQGLRWFPSWKAFSYNRSLNKRLMVINCNVYLFIHWPIYIYICIRCSINVAPNKLVLPCIGLCWISIFPPTPGIITEIFVIFSVTVVMWGARGSIVDWGTMLQARGSHVRVPMRSLGFFYLPSSRTMTLESTQNQTEMSTRNVPGK
jgi:hypothetical protein